jgi:hypothetical protein
LGRAFLRSQTEDPPGSTFAISGRALQVWGAFALLLMLVAVPPFSTVLPPLVDYPNHLARMHLLAEGGNAFYAVRWAALPNLAEDLIVPPLARVLPLDTAGKLFLVMIFALMAGGAVCLNRCATGGWRLWPLLAFLLLYNRILLWGFLNYLFGIGVALVGEASWLALEARSWWLRVLASSLVALACFFSHIAAFGFYALVLLGVEALPACTELRARRWTALGRRIGVAAPQFILPALLLLGGPQDAAGGTVGYAGVWRKIDLLFNVFDNYNRVFDVACFVAFLGLIGGLLWTKRLALEPRLGYACAIVFAAYLLLPSQIYGGSGTDHRLPTAIFLLLVAAGMPRFPSRRIATAIGIAAVALLVVRLGVIERVWLRANQVYTADLAGIDLLPRGAKLAVAQPEGLFHVTRIPEVHVATLAIARREAFVPTLFTIPGQQPVMPKPTFAALAEAAQPQILWAALVAGSVADRTHLPISLRGYDFVTFTNNWPIHVPSNHCLTPFFVRPTFQIFAVVDDADCTSSNG